MKERTNQAVWIESQNRWCIRVQVNGKRKAFYSSKVGTRGKNEAERLADEWLKSGYNTPNMKYRDLYELYLQSLSSRNERLQRGSAQLRKMESIGRIWMIPNIGNKRISEISNADYQKCIDAAFDAGRSRKTLLHINSLFTGIYKTARKNRIHLEPPEFVEIYENAPSYPRDAMQTKSVSELFTSDLMQERGKTVPCYHIHAFRIMCLLGLRRGEVAGLQWSDIDGLVLNIQRSVNNLGEITQGKTKSAKRKIYIYPYAMQEFDAQRKYQKKIGLITPWIFANPYTGTPDYDGLFRQWELFCRSNGIKNVNLHELRHTNISLAMGKIDADILKPIVGHSKTMDTFGTYGHETEENLKLYGDIMQSIFESILKK